MGSRLRVVSLVTMVAVASTAQGQPGPMPTPPSQPTPPSTGGPGPLPATTTTEPAEPSAVAGPITPQDATPPPPAPPVEPVVLRGGISSSNIALLVGAGAGVGAAFGLVLAAHSDASDADAARSYADYERISSRSDRLYVASIVSAAAGIGLATLAIYRLKLSKEHDTTVAITPSSDGGSFVVSRTW